MNEWAMNLDTWNDRFEDTEQPEEGDYVISDAGPLGSWYRVSVMFGTSADSAFFSELFGTEAAARDAIALHMARNASYTDIWYQDDHGGLALLDDES